MTARPPVDGALCSVDGTLGPSYGPSLRGRQDSNFLGSGVPILLSSIRVKLCLWTSLIQRQHYISSSGCRSEISINSGVPAPALALTPNPRWRKLVRSCTENWRSMRRWQKRSCMRWLWIGFLTPLQNIESMEEGFTNTYSDWLSKAGKIWWESWKQMQLLIPTLLLLMAVDTWKRGCLSSSPIIFSLGKSFKNVLESRKEGMYHHSSSCTVQLKVIPYEDRCYPGVEHHKFGHCYTDVDPNTWELPENPDPVFILFWYSLK